MSAPFYYGEKTNFRVTYFPDLATALANNRQFGYGEIIMIKGDATRFKLGSGSKYSAKNPAVPTAKTFSQLPWYSSGGTKSNAPTSDTKLAVNATATLTAAQLSAATYITSTSAAATTITLPTLASFVTALQAAGYTIAAGSRYSFTIDNSGGANTVTIALGTGLTAGTGALTGSNTLTVPAGQFADFTIFFKSTSAALIYRTL